MGHVPLFSSERLRFCPSSGIYSFWYLVFCWFCCCFFHCIGCSCIDVTLFWLSLTLLVRLLTFSLLSFCAVVVVCRRVDTGVRFVLWWCGLLLFLFLGVFGDVVLLSCMSYGLICCSFGGWLRCLCCFHTLYSRFRGRRFFFYCPFLCCFFPDYVAGCCPVLLLLLFA